MKGPENIAEAILAQMKRSAPEKFRAVAVAVRQHLRDRLRQVADSGKVKFAGSQWSPQVVSAAILECVEALKVVERETKFGAKFAVGFTIKETSDGIPVEQLMKAIEFGTSVSAPEAILMPITRRVRKDSAPRVITELNEEVGKAVFGV